MEKPVVGFCVSQFYSPLVMYKRYQPLMDYLSDHTPYHFELIICRSNREALKLLKKGTAQILLLDDLAVLEAHEKLQALPILKPLNSYGQPYFRSAIVVADKSAIRKLRDLKGKNIAFGPHHSTQGNLFPRSLLKKNGISLGDLSSYKYLNTDEAIVKSLLTGNSDAGALVDVVAEKYVNRGLRIIAYTEPIPTSPILVRKEAYNLIAPTVMSALLNIKRNSSTDELMEQWDMKIRYGFVPAKIADYQQDIRFIKSVSTGCGKACHKAGG
jgi:phosphonate transport system substrate-binding protein